jgi:hypothetical protein
MDVENRESLQNDAIEYIACYLLRENNITLLKAIMASVSSLRGRQIWLTALSRPSGLILSRANIEVQRSDATVNPMNSV